MNGTSLQNEDWRMLLKSMRDGTCILLLGPGVAIDPNDADGDPLPLRLALELAAAMQGKDGEKRLVVPKDLAHVAQVYVHEMPRKRPGLDMAIEDFYAKYRDTTTPLHRDLAALPFSLCVTTTPERFLLNAFAQTPGKQPIYDFYD